MKRLLRIKCSLIVAVILLWVAQVPQVVAEDAVPEQLVRSTTDQMLALFVENRQMIERDPRSLYGLVDDIVLPHFDFQRMSQWVLGKYWRSASAEQREKFLQEFRNLLVRTYSSLLFDYTSQTIEYLPSRITHNGERATVRTVINGTDGAKIPIVYSMYRKNNNWQVYDVAIEGISLVSNYRSTFASEIRSSGLDKLIERLTQRNQQTTT